MMLMIHPSCLLGVINYFSNIIDQRENFFAWGGVDDGHSEELVYITLCDGNFCNLPIVYFNVIKNSKYSVRINMRHIQVLSVPEYGALFTFEFFFHHIRIILVSMVAHLF